MKYDISTRCDLAGFAVDGGAGYEGDDGDEGGEGGERLVRRGAGGLVTALVGLAGQLNDAVWVCAASTDEDVVVAREYKDTSLHVSMTARPCVPGA